ncbi:hypothetical protein ACFOVU_28730 [Nocardiopsis sediminis]|uniref:CHRD domain-containing protein n=1 Tax=Nocardiopsis sediminis TaxID=1778267 RepID=A0ABV8FZ68_9ACTN
MQKSTVRRIVFTAIAAPALAFGAPAVAMADAHYENEFSKAGPKGATSFEVKAHAKDGRAEYHEAFEHAGPHGAVSSHTHSSAD